MATDHAKWMKLGSGSDIRGRETLLTDEVCEKIGYAFACVLAEKLNTTPDMLAIAVGRDTRASGRRIKSALARGVTAADVDVLDCSLCAAPALFRLLSHGTPESPMYGKVHGAVMVTAGDALPDTNGFKFMTAQGGLSEDDIARILHMAATTEAPERLVTRVSPMDSYRKYLLETAARLLEDSALKPLLGLYVVVNGNTTGGAFFADLMEGMGADVDRPDDGERLADAVARCGADMGFDFDADCSRAYIFDGTGRPVNGNRLIALLAAILLEDQPGATIVTDSVTSTGLSAFIPEWGGVHYRFKRGWRSVIAEAKRLNAEGINCPLAIETTGHAAFRENEFLDDGIYLALRVACEALDCKREGKTVFDPLSDLSEAVEEDTLRLCLSGSEDPDASCQEVVEVILSHTLQNPGWRMAPDSREGVRILFNLDGGVNNAWFQLRKSVHDRVMVLHAESDIPGGVKRVLMPLYALIRDTQLLDLRPLKAAIEE